jgi:hypothetical protein
MRELLKQIFQSKSASVTESVYMRGSCVARWSMWRLDVSGGLGVRTVRTVIFGLSHLMIRHY